MARPHIVVSVGAVALLAAILSLVEAGPKQAVEDCMQQTGATQADLENFMKTGEGSQPLKCMLSCGLEKIKFITADGAFDVNYIKSHLPASFDSMIDTCVGKANSSDDVCQRSTTYLYCFMTAQPKFFVEFLSHD